MCVVASKRHLPNLFWRRSEFQPLKFGAEPVVCCCCFFAQENSLSDLNAISISSASRSHPEICQTLLASKMKPWIWNCSLALWGCLVELPCGLVAFACQWVPLRLSELFSQNSSVRSQAFSGLLSQRRASMKKVWVYQLKQSSKNIETSSNSNDTFLESSKLSHRQNTYQRNDLQSGIAIEIAGLRIAFWGFFFLFSLCRPAKGCWSILNMRKRSQLMRLASSLSLSLSHCNTAKWKKNAFKRAQLTQTLIKNTLPDVRNGLIFFFFECVKANSIFFVSFFLLLLFYRWLISEFGFERTKTRSNSAIGSDGESWGKTPDKGSEDCTVHSDLSANQTTESPRLKSISCQSSQNLMTRFHH